MYVGGWKIYKFECIIYNKHNIISLLVEWKYNYQRNVILIHYFNVISIHNPTVFFHFGTKKKMEYIFYFNFV